MIYFTFSSKVIPKFNGLLHFYFEGRCPVHLPSGSVKFVHNLVVKQSSTTIGLHLGSGNYRSLWSS